MKNQYRRNECLIYTRWISFCPLYTSVGRVRLDEESAAFFFGEWEAAKWMKWAESRVTCIQMIFSIYFFCFRNWAKKLMMVCVSVDRAPSSSAVGKIEGNFFLARWSCNNIGRRATTQQEKPKHSKFSFNHGAKPDSEMEKLVEKLCINIMRLDTQLSAPDWIPIHHHIPSIIHFSNKNKRDKTTFAVWMVCAVVWLLLGSTGWRKMRRKKVSLSSWFAELSCCTAVVEAKELSFDLLRILYSISVSHVWRDIVFRVVNNTIYIPAAAKVFKSHDFPVFIHIFLFVFPIIYTQVSSRVNDVDWLIQAFALVGIFKLSSIDILLEHSSIHIELHRVIISDENFKKYSQNE